MDLIEKLDQHYVSWFYLKYWRITNESGQVGIWAKRGDSGAEFAQGRNKLANDHRFYRVEVDDVVQDMMRYKYPRETAEPQTLAMLDQLDVLTAANEYIAAKLTGAEKLDVIRTNYLEDKYDRLETVFSKTLANLNKNYMDRLWGTASAVNDTYAALIGLYATQLFRTQVMRNVLLKNITSMTLVRDTGQIVLSDSQKASLLKLITYLESISLSRRLYEDRVSITIYMCDEESSFYTSDAPAQRISAEMHSTGRFKRLFATMPLSPRHFMEIRKDPNVTPKIRVHPITAQGVEQLNAMFLARNEGNDVYATTQAALTGM